MRSLCLVSHTGHPHGISATEWASPLGSLPTCRIPHISHDQMVTLCCWISRGCLRPGWFAPFCPSPFPHAALPQFFFLNFFYTEKRKKRSEDSEGYSSSANRVQCTLRWTWACPGFWHVFWSDRAKLSFTYKISHLNERMFQLTDNPWWWLFCEP